jgi:hypothetical protein
MDDYLVKPFEEEEIIQTLSKHYRRRDKSTITMKPQSSSEPSFGLDRIKDLVADALVKPVLADTNKHGKGILWIRAVGPNTDGALHGYGTQALVYMRLSNTFLGLGGVAIVDGNLRSDVWHSDGLQ